MDKAPKRSSRRLGRRGEHGELPVYPEAWCVPSSTDSKKRGRRPQIGRMMQEAVQKRCVEGKRTAGEAFSEHRDTGPGQMRR